MLELYIDGKKADIGQDTDIALDYNVVNIAEPTSIQSPHSKTIELKGTQTNNQIFGLYYRLDHSSTETQLNAKKKIPFELTVDGLAFMTGYLSLDKVAVKNGAITYSVTLYDGLVDFFYALGTNEDGTEKTLLDIDLGINFDRIWDRGYISETWTMLDDGHRPALIAVPTYSGYYDDFNSQRIAMYYNGIEQDTNFKEAFFGKDGTDSTDSKVKLANEIWGLKNEGSAWNPTTNPHTFAPIVGDEDEGDKWILLDATRDLDEWEARDLRSNQQRPAIRLKNVIDAISNPDNNGGYTVEWDDEIYTSNLINDTYIMFPRLDFSNSKTNDVIELDYEEAVTTTTTQIWEEPSLASTKWKTVWSGDTTEMISPQLEANINFQIDTKGTSLENNVEGYMASMYRNTTTHYESNYTNICYSSIIYDVAIFVDGQYWGRPDMTDFYSPLMLETEMVVASNINKYAKDMMNKNAVPYLKSRIADKVGITEWTSQHIYLTNDDVELSDNGLVYIMKTPIKIKSMLPKGNVEVRYFCSFASTSARAFGSDASSLQWEVRNNLMFDKNHNYTDILNMVSMPFNDDDDKTITNGVYDGSMPPNIQQTRLDKETVLSGSKSPFKYLIWLTKMFGLKFDVDAIAKTVKIMQRKDWYLDEVKDLKYDRREINITPVSVNYKWGDWGLNLPETYATNLYAKKSKEEFGHLKVNTGYELNTNTSEMFKDSVYNSAIPYRHNSMYFNENVKLSSAEYATPTILYSPTVEITAFSTSGTPDDFETRTTNIKGYSRLYKYVTDKRDPLPKLCCFDDDNGQVDDITDTLVIFTGMKYLDRGNLWLSDNSVLLEKIADGQCYYGSYGTAIPPNCSPILWLPIFSTYYGDGSWIFNKPSYSFTDDTVSEDQTLMFKYWKNYLNDLYDEDGKTITINAILEETPDKAIRKFYRIDNTLWIITNISGYTPNKGGLTTLTLQKVANKENYLS